MSFIICIIIKFWLAISLLPYSFARQKDGATLECLKDYVPPTAQMIEEAKAMIDEVGILDGHNDLPSSVKQYHKSF